MNKKIETAKIVSVPNPIVDKLTHNALAVQARANIVKAVETLHGVKATITEALHQIVATLGKKPRTAEDQQARKKAVNAFVRGAFAGAAHPDSVDVYLSAFWKEAGYTPQNKGNTTRKAGGKTNVTASRTAADAVPESECEELLDFSNERTRMEHFKAIVLSLKAQGVTQAALVEMVRKVYA